MDALLAATTPEQIERIVSAWTLRAEKEADNLLAPIHALARDGKLELDGALAAMRSILVEQSLELQRVKMRERLSKRLRFGKASEKLESHQLALAYLAFDGAPDADGNVPEPPPVPVPDASEAEVDEEAAAALGLDEPTADNAPAVPQTPDPEKTKRHGGGGRRPLPEHLRKIETPVRVPEAERPCTLCGKERTCVGHRPNVWS